MKEPRWSVIGQDELISDIRHARRAIEDAFEKAQYGDSLESDLLEAFHTIDALLDDGSPQQGVLRPTIEAVRQAFFSRIDFGVFGTTDEDKADMRETVNDILYDVLVENAA